MQAMFRFTNAGYNLVTKRKLSGAQPQELSGDLDVVDVTEDGDGFYVRMSSQGYEYVKPMRKKKKKRNLRAASNFTAPPLLPASHKNDDDDRSLVILGEDTRSRVTTTNRYPYSTIMELDYGGGQGGCTATVVSRKAALTAGHCVFEGGQFFNIARGVPGRDDGSEPFGSWAVDYMTTFETWKADEPRNYDVAVIVFQANADGKYPGDVVGAMGMGRPTLNKLEPTTVTGYPVDKADGQMWTSGACPGPWRMDSIDFFGFHVCDTKAGNSGSAILDLRTNIAYGVHGYGFSSFNGAALLEGSHFDAVYEWTLRGGSPGGGGGDDNDNGGGDDNDDGDDGDDTPPPVGGCPCDDIGFWLLKLICQLIFAGQCSGFNS